MTPSYDELRQQAQKVICVLCQLAWWMEKPMQPCVLCRRKQGK